MRSSYWFLLSAILVTGNASGGAEKRPLTFDDLMKMQRVADPQISPDGRWIAYTVTAVNKENNSRNTDIWLLPVAGGEARQLDSDCSRWPLPGPGSLAWARKFAVMMATITP